MNGKGDIIKFHQIKESGHIILPCFFLFLSSYTQSFYNSHLWVFLLFRHQISIYFYCMDYIEHSVHSTVIISNKYDSLKKKYQANCLCPHVFNGKTSLSINTELNWISVFFAFLIFFFGEFTFIHKLSMQSILACYWFSHHCYGWVLFESICVLILSDVACFSPIQFANTF